MSLTTDTLVDVAVFADCFLTGLQTVVHSDEQTNVEVHRQRNHWLNWFTVFVGHRVYHEENHSQGLLMAVGFAKWCRTIFIETNMGLSRTKYRHIRKCHTKHTVAANTRQCWLQEGYRSAVWVQIHHIKVAFVFPHPIHQINCIRSKHYKNKKIKETCFSDYLLTCLEDTS